VTASPAEDLEPAAEAPPDSVPRLARNPDILELVADKLERDGVAGERRLLKLLYLAVTTRLLERPVSITVKGPSAGGKSYIVESTLRLFPRSAYYALSAMSDHALAYDREPLVHRMLVLYEATGLSSDMATYLIRSLLSEGRVRYLTVVKGKDGMQPQLIERPGPTGLITTTTEVRLHPENETRMLSLTVTDTPEQTKAVMLAHAADDGGPGPDPTPWHEYQDWLAGRSTDVVVPYARTLAKAIPPVAVRLRRDFPSIVTLVRAHALLHQVGRDTDQHGRILATIADYAAVRELVSDLVSDAAERTIPDTVRETVRAVGDLTPGGGEATVVDVARQLGLDESAAWRRCRVAIDRGYLINLEERRARPARIVLGAPLPADVTILPTAEELERLHGCSGVPGGQAHPSADARSEREPYVTPSIESAAVQPYRNGAGDGDEDGTASLAAGSPPTGSRGARGVGGDSDPRQQGPGTGSLADRIRAYEPDFLPPPSPMEVLRERRRLDATDRALVRPMGTTTGPGA